MHDHRQKYYIMNTQICKEKNLQIFVYFNSTPLTFTKRVLNLTYDAHVGNRSDNICHTITDAYSAEQVLLNKQQI